MKKISINSLNDFNIKSIYFFIGTIIKNLKISFEFDYGNILILPHTGVNASQQTYHG